MDVEVLYPSTSDLYAARDRTHTEYETGRVRRDVCDGDISVGLQCVVGANEVQVMGFLSMGIGAFCFGTQRIEMVWYVLFVPGFEKDGVIGSMTRVLGGEMMEFDAEVIGKLRCESDDRAVAVALLCRGMSGRYIAVSVNRRYVANDLLFVADTYLWRNVLLN